MAGHRKLGRPTDQRKALLRGLVTELLMSGKVTTTISRAKEVRKIAEKIITLAIQECENTVTVEKATLNEKGQQVEVTVTNDMPSRLAARRQIMALIYDVPTPQKEDESKSDYKERAAEVAHPLVEKIFREIGPKYKKRAAEKGQGGGYTRMIKMGPRRGDAAEMVILELVD
jgi:large subunit ribosomal protein L17